MQGILEIVRNMVGFVLLAGICLNLSGSKEYRKYASVLVGLLLILLVITSLARWMGTTMDFSFWQNVELQGQNREWENELQYAEDSRREVLYEQYEQVIREQVTELAARQTLHLTDIQCKWTEGELDCMLLRVGYGEAEPTPAVDTITIDRVRIAEDGEVQVEEEVNATVQEAMDALREELSSIYRLSEERIQIRA